MGMRLGGESRFTKTSQARRVAHFRTALGTLGNHVGSTQLLRLIPWGWILVHVTLSEASPVTRNVVKEQEAVGRCQRPSLGPNILPRCQLSIHDVLTPG